MAQVYIQKMIGGIVIDKEIPIFTRDRDYVNNILKYEDKGINNAKEKIKFNKRCNKKF